MARREEPRLDVSLAFAADASDELDADHNADADGKTSSTESDRQWGACPHIDRNDERCAHRFSIGRIDQAFNVCFGSFRACPHFHRFNNEIAIEGEGSERQHPTLVEIRIITRGGPHSAAEQGRDGLAAVGNRLRRTGS